MQNCPVCNSTNIYGEVDTDGILKCFICYDCEEEYFDESGLYEECDSF